MISSGFNSEFDKELSKFGSDFSSFRAGMITLSFVLEDSSGSLASFGWINQPKIQRNKSVKP